MGFMNKIKGILFDEDEIEVPVDSEELQDKSNFSKKNDKKVNGGFIDHHHEEDESEDTITEIIVPKDEETVKVNKEVHELNESKFNLVDDDVMEHDFPTNKENKDIDNYFAGFERQSISREEKNRSVFDDDFDDTKNYKTVDEVRKEYNIAAPVKKHTEEIKDYRKLLNNNRDEAKKPFTVTPVISPVYGILDKNYTADEIVEKRELINKTNSGVKPRTFGPVSYNDEPDTKKAVKVAKEVKEPSLKEELVELNTTINELINDTVNPDNIEVPNLNKNEEIKEVPLEEEEIIQTENYDELETSSIEKDYIGNNNVEDAFESTGEFNSINERDKEIKEEQEENKEEVEEIPVEVEDDDVIDLDALIDKSEVDDTDENLDNTIETDLFNLIDSMYKSDDNEVEEED